MEKNKADEIYQKLLTIEKLIDGAKVGRFLYHPFLYLQALFIRKTSGLFFKDGFLTTRQTIFNTPFQLTLPSSIDIFLFGCRANKSDIVLSKFFLKHLNEVISFFDIGANFGFFTIFCSEWIAKEGTIYAFEPTEASFKLLNKNTKERENIFIFNKAVGAANEQINLYTFNILYSEYNTTRVDDFLKGSDWFEKNQPASRSVEAICLDSFKLDTNAKPMVIKIDAENSEYNIFLGAKKIIAKYKPTFVLRYWYADRENENQIKTIEALFKEKYTLFLLDSRGDLVATNNDLQSLEGYHLEYVVLKYGVSKIDT